MTLPASSSSGMKIHALRPARAACAATAFARLPVDAQPMVSSPKAAAALAAAARLRAENDRQELDTQPLDEHLAAAVLDSFAALHLATEWCDSARHLQHLT